MRTTPDYFDVLRYGEARRQGTGGAVFSYESPEPIYRYALWRNFDPPLLRPARTILWICLNPSTADETEDDPTMRRCISFSKQWGYGGMFVTNIFGLRSTDPKGLKTIADPNGPDNDRVISDLCEWCEKIVVAWGAHGAFQQRAQYVIERLIGPRTFYCLGRTKQGYPKHPLYVKGVTPLEPYPVFVK